MARARLTDQEIADQEIAEQVRRKVERIIDDAVDEACEGVAADLGLDPDDVRAVYERQGG